MDESRHDAYNDRSVASAGLYILAGALVLLMASILVAQRPLIARTETNRWSFDDAESTMIRRLGPESPQAPSTEHLPNPSRMAPTERVMNREGLPGWWDARVHQSLRPDATPLSVSLESLLAATLTHSAYIKVVSDIPLIRETAIVEADANFDWISFLESRWNDVSDPVGNVLTTGNQLPGAPNQIPIEQDRFLDRRYTGRGGVRRRNSLGARFEVAQEVGRQRTNSTFFSPANQGTSRVTINYTQPLLQGAGKQYNRSLITLAEIDAAAGRDELSRALQEQLVQVTASYWQLYMNRGRLLQKQRLITQAREILTKLEQRRGIDALRSQIVRARSAVEARSAEISRARTEVRNTESRIRALVNDPSLGNSRHHELIPQDRPMITPRELDPVSSIETALQNRPEIALVIKRIQSASVRLKMSKNELLPALNVILDTYVSGLRDNYNVGEAWLDQFRLGEPTYSAGVQYEFPFGNRAAKARYTRRRLELRQLESELKTEMENLRQEVEVATAEVATTYQEMQANHRSMDAAAEQVDYIYDRWQFLPGTDGSASFLLEDLLDAQERLNAAESLFLQAQVNYNVTQMLYLQTIGTLLQSERISIERFCEYHLPRLHLNKSGVNQQREFTLPGNASPGEEDPDRSALTPIKRRR